MHVRDEIFVHSSANSYRLIISIKEWLCPRIRELLGLDDCGARPDVVSKADPLPFPYTQSRCFARWKRLGKKCRDFSLGCLAADEMSRGFGGRNVMFAVVRLKGYMRVLFGSSLIQLSTWQGSRVLKSKENLDT